MKAFTNLSPQDFKEHLNTINGSLIDVRTKDEFESSYINNAKNIDVNNADFEKNIGSLDKHKPYFVYCRSGARSGKAMQIMQDLGFNEVYNLEGGIMAWEHKGNEVEYGDFF